jgi:hypothetical protein
MPTRTMMIAVAAALTFWAAGAEASCTRSGNYVTCSDGSTYNTTGSSTYGKNTRTGSNWSQTTVGKSTDGQDSQGNSSTNTGNSTFGTDSQGNRFNCKQGGNTVASCN